MDTKKLRQKILDLAIHGKLVPQDPNDEPASVLLERIRAEKEQLIKEGKIKAPKKSKSAGDTSHYPKDVPFEVPQGWVWCSFPAVAELISGQDFPPEKYNSSAKGIPYIIGASNIEDGHLRISRWTEYPSVLSQKGDVLVVCKGAGVGKVAVNDIGTVHIARQIQAVRIQDEIISSDFMRILIDWCVPSIVTQANGLIPGLKRELLLNVLLPIPPRNEQDLIVSTLCGAFDIIKGMEVENFKLEDDIRKSRERVLELAISGKLVPQDPSEEPAIELLRRINPGFIPSHNLHYEGELPSGWALCCLEDVLEYEQPQAYIVNSTDYSDEYKTPVLTPGKSFVLGYTNEVSGICNHLPVIIFDDFTTESKYVDFPFKVKSSAMKILRSRGEIDLRYIAMYMSITRLAGDTHKRYWISEYSKIRIPIPPYAEQLRIIEKVRELFFALSAINPD